MEAEAVREGSSVNASHAQCKSPCLAQTRHQFKVHAYYTGSTCQGANKNTGLSWLNKLALTLLPAAMPTTRIWEMSSSVT